MSILDKPTVRALGVGALTAVTVAGTLVADNAWSVSDTFATLAAFLGSVFGVAVPTSGKGGDE